MQTRIHPRFADEQEVAPAQAILRSCVHCGFCNATCPTYLELGDERDGPRGRIYLIKQMLESGTVTRLTQRHLDRCLTCRNCETTCPSGVEYGQLVDIGRRLVEQQVARPLAERVQRRLLRAIVPYRRRFAWLTRLARLVRPALPSTLRAKLPRNRQAATPRTTSALPSPTRRMLLAAGCVQSVATPATNQAAIRVLARLGIRAEEAPRAGCCGALDYHLGEHEPGLAHARRLVDAWWPAIEDGAEAIVLTASGCSSMIKDYGRLLRDDPAYSAKAARVSALTRDIAEVLEHEDLASLAMAPTGQRIAFHCPCTLQHAQKLPGLVEGLLERSGFELTSTENPHLCCGSAGSYSLLQPALSTRLRDAKLAALTADSPDLIATANVGCQMHLESAAAIPVRHWIELLDDASTEHRDDAL